MLSFIWLTLSIGAHGGEGGSGGKHGTIFVNKNAMKIGFLAKYEQPCPLDFQPECILSDFAKTGRHN
jgi:hypothetical protein